MSKQKYVTQPRLLWGHGETGRQAKWLKAVLLKIIGPFDIQSFSSVKDFIVFWIGEKIQGLGFVWELLALNTSRQKHF